MKGVTYSLLDSYHSLCIDKRDIILTEIEACEGLYYRRHRQNDYRNRNIKFENDSRLYATCSFLCKQLVVQMRCCLRQSVIRIIHLVYSQYHHN